MKLEKILSLLKPSIFCIFIISCGNNNNNADKNVWVKSSGLDQVQAANADTVNGKMELFMT